MSVMVLVLGGLFALFEVGTAMVPYRRGAITQAQLRRVLTWGLAWDAALLATAELALLAGHDHPGWALTWAILAMAAQVALGVVWFLGDLPIRAAIAIFREAAQRARSQ
jgi:hypothetical protein